MVWCVELREEHSKGARKGYTPRRLHFGLYFSYDNEEGKARQHLQSEVYCWSRRELNPLCPAQREQRILIPKNGRAPAEWSAGIIRPAMVFCG